MTETSFPPILREALSSLLSDRTAIPWPQRHQFAMDLGKHLVDIGPSDLACSLATILAKDDRPEVRKEVADLLPSLPEDTFFALAAQLGHDPNAFVRSSVERVMGRRRKTAHQSQQARRDLGNVESRYVAMAKIHGPLAAEKARRLADEQYDVLVRSTLHDLKNIVSPVSMHTSTLLKQFSHGKPNPAKCLELLEDMRRQLTYLERFMESMHAYAHASGAPRVRTRIADLVTEAVNMTRSVLEKVGVNTGGITVHHPIPPHLSAPVVRHQMVMALIHLIKNACESFILGHGRRHAGTRDIFVTAEQQPGGLIAITVRDTGPGIPAKNLPTLREFRLGNSTKKQHGGTGFGLPSASRFARDHGGTLDIDRAPGHGTLVVITIQDQDDGLASPSSEPPNDEADAATQDPAS